MNEIEQKEIEEMAKVIAKRDCNLFDKCPKEPKHNCLSQEPAIMLESSKNYITIATWLINEGYRNCKDKVVLTKEEYQNDFSSQFNKGYEKGSKETAREFAKKLKKVIHERDYVEGYAYLGICEEIDELAKEYGVEVE